MKIYATTDHTGRPTDLLLTDEDAKARDLDPADGKPWPPAAEPAEKKATAPANKAVTAPANK